MAKSQTTKRSKVTLGKPKIQKMTEEKIVNTYLKLSEQLYKQYSDRRSLEWRIHISLWTFMALIGYLCVTNNIHLGNYSLFIFTVIPIHIIWIIKIDRGETFEQELSIRYRMKVDKILAFNFDSEEGTKLVKRNIQDKSKMPDWMRTNFKSFYWWFGVLVATTTFMCLGIWWLIK